MYVLVLVAVYFVSDAQPPLVVVTRPTMQHYISKEACNADGPKQANRFMNEVPKDPIVYAAKCVEVSSSAGDPA